MLCSQLFFKESQGHLVLLLALFQLTMYVPCYANDGIVRIGTQTVISVPAGSGSMSVSERAKQIQRNLDNSLVAASNRSPSTVKVTYVKGQPVITLGGFLVTRVDSATAHAAHTTPATLTQRWVNSLRAALSNKASVNAYMAQLTGTGSTAEKNEDRGSYPHQVAQSAKGCGSIESAKKSYSHRSALAESDDSGTGANSPSQTPYARARVIFVPAGLVMPLKLSTALSSQISKPGDVVIATLTDPVNLGDAIIPANTMITGRVTKSASGAYLSKSGRLGIKFTSMRTPDGVDTPITAHILGSIGKFQVLQEGTDVFRGETGETKLKKALVGAAVGAGSGALLGTTIGAIAGGGRGAGRGSLAGIAIGTGVGLLSSYLQKGSDVSVSSQETVKLQLDAPARFAMTSFAGVQN